MIEFITKYSPHEIADYINKNNIDVVAITYNSAKFYFILFYKNKQ